MEVQAIKTRLFAEGEDLVRFIREHVSNLNEGSIVVIASKIVALAEARVVDSVENKEELIKSESEWQKQVLPKWWLTIRDGTVVVNAGIDESNAEGKIILLPKDCFAAAHVVRRRLMEAYNVKNIGVIITDSRITPLRAGVLGVALGYAGFTGIRDYRGKPDLYGRPMEVTQTNSADSLATAATFLMGEGDESQPLAVVEGAPVEWVDAVDRNELKMPREQDLFKHLFE